MFRASPMKQALAAVGLAVTLKLPARTTGTVSEGPEPLRQAPG